MNESTHIHIVCIHAHIYVYEHTHTYNIIDVIVLSVLFIELHLIILEWRKMKFRNHVKKKRGKNTKLVDLISKSKKYSN